MRIDLSKINTAEFFLRPCLVGGDSCVLVEPHGVGVVRWTKDNRHLRSSIWNAHGELVSAGFFKFFNIGEENDKDGNFVPGKVPFDIPTDLDGAEVLEKLDGSLLVVSYYKGEKIIRTRGTISAEDTLSNGDEIPFLKEKYPKFGELWSEAGEATVGTSLLFEWTSPRQRIVLDYGDEPQLWLVGGINHDDYSLIPQYELDWIAENMGIPRPARYPVTTMEELRCAVKVMRGKEGVVLYKENFPWKIKSMQYLALHWSKGRVNTFDKVIDIWLEFGRPDYQTFFDLLVEKEDYETADYARPSLSKIADTAKHVADIQRGMEAFIERNLRGLPRKQQAEIVFASYGKTNRAAMVFHILDGKGLTDDDVKKLFLQVLK